MPEKSPTTLREWTDLTARLVHVLLSPNRESHDLTAYAMGIRAKAEDGSTSPLVGDISRPIYPSADVAVAMDALVTGVDYHPPHVPPRDEDALFPHGRLRLTVDLFLDKPMVGEKEVANGK